MQLEAAHHPTVVGVPRSDQVGLVHGPVDDEGVLGEVGAEGAVGQVDVVMGAVVDGEGELAGGQVDGADPAGGDRAVGGGRRPSPGRGRG